MLSEFEIIPETSPMNETFGSQELDSQFVPPTATSLDSGVSPASTEILLLPDGRILAHHLTPEVAEILETLSPSETGPTSTDFDTTLS